MKQSLFKALNSFKADNSNQHASQVLNNLAKNDTFNLKIYNYQNHRFAPKDKVINALQYFASHEDSDSARDDIRDSGYLDDTYNKQTWIDCNHLKPVTASQVEDIIRNGLM